MIGGGQASLPILQTGCTLTAIEYGENFSKLCKEKFKEFKKFSVITEKFENVSFSDSAYDLVYSALAFHWVPEDIGYSKIFIGIFALLMSFGSLVVALLAFLDKRKKRK